MMHFWLCGGLDSEMDRGGEMNRNDEVVRGCDMIWDGELARGRERSWEVVRVVQWSKMVMNGTSC